MSAAKKGQPQTVTCCHIATGTGRHCIEPSEWMMREEGQHPSEADQESCAGHLGEMVGDKTIEIRRRDVVPATLPINLAAAPDLYTALLGVSPWKLQDCWCSEDDCGGAKKHGAPCLAARAAIAKAVKS